MASTERLLSVGLRSYQTINTPKYDLGLLFCADNLVKVGCLSCGLGLVVLQVKTHIDVP